LISQVQVRLAGGIGNQIFQFFAGKMVSDKYNSRLVVDCKMLELKDAHPGSDIRELEFFSSDSEVFVGPNRPAQISFDRTKIKLAKESRFFSHLFNFYCDDNVDFKRVEKFKGVLRLSGYFQTLQVIEFIRKSYPNLNLRPANLSLNFATAINEIDGDFCAIHIRRGDYLHKKSIHTELNSEYYLRALNLLRETSGNNHMKYVIFSDEPETTSLLLPKDLNYVHAGKFELSTIEELYLMSQASAFVIANSTFSFWAAYLAKANCPVFVPRNWFKSESQSIVEIIPSHWNLIPN
jgi:hypothetical protein